MKQVYLGFKTNPAALFTAGYQGRDLDAFVRLLAQRGIERVVDVREHPTSRRPGFAKTPLSTALTSEGIAYVHVREAGNPFRHAPSGEGDAAGATSLDTYAKHLDARPDVVETVARAVDGSTSVLVCFERDPRACHRTPLAERVAARLGLAVVAL